MGLWTRIKRSMRALFGGIVEATEDPELILQQTIRDMRDRIPDLNNSVAQVMATERLLAKNKERLEVGETFPLGGRTWIVVGIMRSTGSTFDSEVWAKQMKDGSRTVALLNRGASDSDISVSWEDLGYPAHLSAAVRDLWAKKDVGKSTGTFSAKVPSHGVVMLRVTP